MKICNQCLEEKEFNQFYKRKDNKDGYRNNCKLCHNLITKSGTIKYQQKEESKEKAKIHNKEYWIENKEYLTIKNKEKYYRNRESYLMSKKDYYVNNKEVIIDKNIKYYCKRKKTDDLFKFKCDIVELVRRSFKSRHFRKNSRTEEILGISINGFRLYLESKFEHWMTWDNKGLYNGELNYGWDIDHIIPLSSAKIQEDVVKLNHYTNLQPLCSKINRDIKRDKLDYKKISSN